MEKHWNTLSVIASVQHFKTAEAVLLQAHPIALLRTSLAQQS
jgi:hypothetical protein